MSKQENGWYVMGKSGGRWIMLGGPTTQDEAASMGAALRGTGPYTDVRTINFDLLYEQVGSFARTIGHG